MIPPGAINDPGVNFQRSFQEFTQRPDNPGQRAQDAAAARGVEREQNDATRTNEVRRADRPADPNEGVDRTNNRREVRTETRAERTGQTQETQEVQRTSADQAEQERERIDQVSQSNLGIPSGTPEPGALINIVV